MMEKYMETVFVGEYITSVTGKVESRTFTLKVEMEQNLTK